MYSSGFSIMRWQSSGSRVARRKDLTTGGPMVRLGTKCPSMTSTWMTLAPPAVARSTWSARWAKSAESIEGASSIKIGPAKPERTWSQRNCGNFSTSCWSIPFDCMHRLFERANVIQLLTSGPRFADDDEDDDDVVR